MVRNNRSFCGNSILWIEECSAPVEDIREMREKGISVLGTPHPGNIPLSDIHLATTHGMDVLVFETIKGSKKLFEPSSIILGKEKYDVSHSIDKDVFATRLRFDEMGVATLERIIANMPETVASELRKSTNPLFLHYLSAKLVLGPRFRTLSSVLLAEESVVTTALENATLSLPNIFQTYISDDGKYHLFEQESGNTLFFKDGIRIKKEEAVLFALDLLRDAHSVYCLGKNSRETPGILLDPATYWGLICVLEYFRSGSNELCFVAGNTLAKYLFQYPTAPKTRDWYDTVMTSILRRVKDVPEKIICRVMPVTDYRRFVSLQHTADATSKNGFLNAYEEYRTAYRYEQDMRRLTMERINTLAQFNDDFSLESFVFDNEQSFSESVCIDYQKVFTLKDSLLQERRKREKRNVPHLWTSDTEALNKLRQAIFYATRDDSLGSASSLRKTTGETLGAYTPEGYTQIAGSQYDVLSGNRTFVPPAVEKMNFFDLKKLMNKMVK